MKPLQRIALVVLLFLAPTSALAGQDTSGRSKAAEESREALSAYRKALERELQDLESRAAENPPGGTKLRDERAIAKKQLEELSREAGHMWESLRSRMDSVVDNVKRQHGDGQARPK